MQDHRGRFKPVNTLTGEVLRKIAKKESLFGMTSDQIFLSMMKSPEKWENVPLLHIGMHPEVQKILGTNEKLISYRQLFNNEGQYLLREAVRQSQSVNPKDQGTFEKAVIKLDEKVNIANCLLYTSRCV